MSTMKTSAAVLGLTPSFGFGDRLGVATPGHVAALRESGGGILPIFAQQSIREMTRTRRSPEQVIGDAFTGATAGGYEGPQGADADHLKTNADIDRTAAAGFCFFTLDPSDYVDRNDGPEFADLPADANWPLRYFDRSIRLPTGTTFHIDQQTVETAALKYGQAVLHAIDLARHV